MLPVFDIPTMLVMTATASVTMALALAVVHARRREGLGLWAWALSCNAVSFVLYAGRGQIADWISMVLANVLLAIAFALALAAVCQFQQRATPWVHMAWPVLAAGAAFPLLAHDGQIRPVALGLLLALQIALILRMLWRQPQTEGNRGARLLGVALALQAVLLLIRAALAALGFIDDYGGGTAYSPIEPPIVLLALVTTILASLGFILMTKDRADALVRHQAAHDALTGIANRRTLIQALNRDVARAIRTRESYALLMLDIDHFKQINDSQGHLTGDRVLCHVAEVLRTRLRTQDLVGRYGGEEFLMLLPDTSARGAMELAESLRQAVADTPLPHEGRPLTATVSIGVFGGRLEPGDSWDMLIHCADQALYAAKTAGRDRVEFASLLREPQPTFPATLV